tara:strand:- start:1086 stop:1685 length:600 start_codon:yes stop_codon:yes gene_type:complete
MARKPGKTYRTSSGKTVDFGALLLANETAPAIGNMNVNARGDEIDPAGNITKSREQIMREYNELNTMVPSDDKIPEGTGISADEDWKDWEPPKTVETSSVPIQPVIPNTPPPPIPTKEPAPEPIKEPEPVKQKQDESKPMTVAQMVEANPDRVIDKTNDTKKLPTGGLAAAVAAAKEVEDNVQESPQQKQLNTPGVRRI